jgi:hypothetical protein
MHIPNGSVFSFTKQCSLKKLPIWPKYWLDTLTLKSAATRLHIDKYHFPLVFASNWIVQVYITSLFFKIEYFYCIMAQRSPFQDTNAFGRVSHNFKMSKANKLPNTSCWVSNFLIWLYGLWQGHLHNDIIWGNISDPCKLDLNTSIAWSVWVINF